MTLCAFFLKGARGRMEKEMAQVKYEEKTHFLFM